jgi:hypothetical protein
VIPTFLRGNKSIKGRSDIIMKLVDLSDTAILDEIENLWDCFAPLAMTIQTIQSLHFSFFYIKFKSE